MDVRTKVVEERREKDVPMGNTIIEHPGFGFSSIIRDVGLPTRQVGKPLIIVQRDLVGQTMLGDRAKGFGDMIAARQVRVVRASSDLCMSELRRLEVEWRAWKLCWDI